MRKNSSLFAYCSLLLFGFLPAIRVNAQQKPNIIFLLTDDHRWDALGYAGNKIIKTPELDELAAQGVYFKNAYVTSAICCISRASMFSGQYESRHKIDGFNTDFSKSAMDNTYPVLLRKAGYYTGFIGKYGVGDNMPEKEFDQWYGFPGQGNYNQKDKNGKFIHLTKLMGNQAEEFLGKTDPNRPFCLSISFKAPHVQGTNTFLPDPADSLMYAHDVITVPSNGSDEYFQRFPPFFTSNNEARDRWKVRFSTPELYQQNVKKYYQLITEVDQVIGRIRQKLKALGLDKNTVIMFAGDNGFYLGEHGLAGKWYGHEESIRVPMILYDPRMPMSQRGKTLSQIALNVDVAPTILSVAGLKVPVGMQGKDLFSLAKNPQLRWRTDFFYEHRFSHPKIPKSEGVAGGRYKYLRYIDQQPVYEELYDLKADPKENTNLAAKAEYRSVLEKMRTRYATLRKESK